MNIPIVKTLILNSIENATSIEMSMKEYLLPHTPGIYIRGSIVPILIPGKFYYRQERDATGKLVDVPITGLADIKGDIFNQSADIVISAKRVKNLATESNLPVQGIKIIKAYIQKFLDDNSAWSRKTSSSYESIWSEFIKPEYLNQHFTNDLFDHIADLMIDMRTDLVEFIGKDKWIMHLLLLKGNDLYIQKSIDYRIFQWSVEHQMELDADYKL